MGNPCWMRHSATRGHQQHRDRGDEGSSEDPACWKHGMEGGNTLSWYDGTRKDHTPARNPAVLRAALAEPKKSPSSTSTVYREMQSVGERQTHPQITDDEVRTEGMQGMQQSGINQLSYAPAQYCAIKLLLQACNRMIKETWVMQSTYQSVERCNN